MKYYGFNFQWMYNKESQQQPSKPDLDALDFLAKNDFNFIRLPLDYNFWIKDFDYQNADMEIFDILRNYIEESQSRGLHVSLNIHRAPGYCINFNEKEKHNLWKDKEPQEGFKTAWKLFARYFADIPSKDLSFDLLNEPPEIGQYDMSRRIHEDLMRSVIKEILLTDPKRSITLDGLGGGNIPMQEFSDLDITQSCRGYQPMALSHYQASWCKETRGLPHPIYPNTLWQNKKWDKQTIAAHYKPWRQLESMDIPVHVGEMGCYNKVSNITALRWFEDLLSLFKEWEWGYSLWEFEGVFGVVNHGRPDTKYEMMDGFKIDRKLWELLKENKSQS